MRTLLFRKGVTMWRVRVRGIFFIRVYLSVCVCPCACVLVSSTVRLERVCLVHSVPRLCFPLTSHFSFVFSFRPSFLFLLHSLFVSVYRLRMQLPSTARSKTTWTVSVTNWCFAVCRQYHSTRYCIPSWTVGPICIRPVYASLKGSTPGT